MESIKHGGSFCGFGGRQFTTRPRLPARHSSRILSTSPTSAPRFQACSQPAFRGPDTYSRRRLNLSSVRGRTGVYCAKPRTMTRGKGRPMRPTRPRQPHLPRPGRNGVREKVRRRGRTRLTFHTLTVRCGDRNRSGLSRRRGQRGEVVAAGARNWVPVRGRVCSCGSAPGGVSRHAVPPDAAAYPACYRRFIVAGSNDMDSPPTRKSSGIDARWYFIPPSWQSV